MRRTIFINVAIALGGLACSIGVGLVLHSPIAGLVVAFGLTTIRLVVDVRLNLHQNVPIEISFLNRYLQLRDSSCDLFRGAAVTKLRAVTSYFDDLANGLLPVLTQSEVFDLLKLLFCNIGSIKEIRATSFGEVGEWRTWWGKQYLEIHKAATKRSVKIERIFILRSEDEAEGAADVMRATAAYGVVKYTLQSRISQSDFNNANNCMIFFDRDRNPVYSLQAMHDGDGKFLSAVIYNDSAHIKPVLDCYGHIEAVSVSIQG
jgi:hypothetical protein